MFFFFVFSVCLDGMGCETEEVMMGMGMMGTDAK